MVLILDFRINNNDVVTNSIVFLNVTGFCLQLYNKVKLFAEFVRKCRSYHVFSLFKRFLDYLRSTFIQLVLIFSVEDPHELSLVQDKSKCNEKEKEYRTKLILTS